jgi:hypothetical protein
MSGFLITSGSAIATILLFNIVIEPLIKKHKKGIFIYPQKRLKK